MSYLALRGYHKSQSWHHWEAPSHVESPVSRTPLLCRHSNLMQRNKASRLTLRYLPAQVTSRVQTPLAPRPACLSGRGVSARRGFSREGATGWDLNSASPAMGIGLLVVKIESRIQACSSCRDGQGRGAEGRGEAVLPKNCSWERWVLNAAREAGCKGTAPSFGFCCVPGKKGVTPS